MIGPLYVLISTGLEIDLGYVRVASRAAIGAQGVEALKRAATVIRGRDSRFLAGGG